MARVTEGQLIRVLKRRYRDLTDSLRGSHAVVVEVHPDDARIREQSNIMAHLRILGVDVKTENNE